MDSLDITDKIFFGSASTFMVPQLVTLFWSKSIMLNRLSLILSLVMWSAYSYRSLKRHKLVWLYLTIGIFNILANLILLCYYKEDKIEPEPVEYIQPPPLQYQKSIQNNNKYTSDKILPTIYSFNKKINDQNYNSLNKYNNQAKHMVDFGGRPMVRNHIFPK